jgi:RNA polymerase sigma-70 factor (sigma-E family)
MECDHAIQSRLARMTGRYDDEFTHFVTARLGALRRVGFLLCQDWQRADDLVQNAITRLYARWDEARKLDHVDAYARTILVREFLAEQRSGWARRVTVGTPIPDRPGTAHDPEAVLDMRAALSVLPPSQRATIVLRFYCDLSVEQTAGLLGCSAGTVKSNTARAMQTLRQQLAGSPALRPRRPGPGRYGGAAFESVPIETAPRHDMPQRDMRPHGREVTQHG